MNVTGIKFSIGRLGTNPPYSYVKVVNIPIFGAQPNDPYILKGADGLGPPEVDVFKSGRNLQGLRAKDRQLVFRIGINPQGPGGTSVSYLRESLYSLLSYHNESLKVSIIGPSGEIMYTEGVVSKFETVPFSKEPIVQLTIDCNGPYFEHPEHLIVAGTGTTTMTVNNIGTAPTPLSFTLNVVSTGSLVTIQNNTFGGRFSFPNNGALIPGDVYQLNTLPGYKSIERWRPSTFALTSLVGNLYQAEVDWITLQPGNNTLSVSSNLRFAGLDYRPLYQGV